MLWSRPSLPGKWQQRIGARHAPGMVGFLMSSPRSYTRRKCGFMPSVVILACRCPRVVRSDPLVDLSCTEAGEAEVVGRELARSRGGVSSGPCVAPGVRCRRVCRVRCTCTCEQMCTRVDWRRHRADARS